MAKLTFSHLRKQVGLASALAGAFLGTLASLLFPLTAGLAGLAATNLASARGEFDQVTCRVSKVFAADNFACKVSLHDKLHTIFVRLSGTYAPADDQPWFVYTKDKATAILLNQHVTLSNTSQSRTTTFARAELVTKQGSFDLARLFVNQGLVWASRSFVDQDLLRLEYRSRAARNGLWAGKDWIYPGDWVKGRKVPYDFESRDAGLGVGSVVKLSSFHLSDKQQAQAGYVCGKKTCRQMVSCEEAFFHLVSCGVRNLDKDGDGIPCEALCQPKRR